MKDPFVNIEQKLKWGKSLDQILDVLEKNLDLGVIKKSESNEEKQWIIDHLKSYMDHNMEKNRDREGEEFYARIKNFILSL
ncbi:hypothetical protein A3A09_00525 [Candidatus Nomurabacteria bacterium RIFCSPLOWO2_01_FULL_42_20]|uniref:Uncharacterized protein n=1 Tax=Candidatus Nomurabacteria bacterium RIFCSPHIGHO2_01_FULL_42_16 TaxID=1801743 RepID=A0A1F6VJ79_9BACT|nr:MAG: hypothetical protein A2824_02745 [Candidatus Nomurabacteria bacterium RIFCSPHIGHO2_01_FULL_42_16]OGI91907.1 MAG: hypothetical protein A3A09_00525 [Candidatus Nomurabacteria bacterium RIFCSPLOWO2_01_FULL_42_20]